MFSLSVNDKEPFPPGNKVSNISEKCTEIELNEDSILNDISFSISLICEINSFLAKFKSSKKIYGGYTDCLWVNENNRVNLFVGGNLNSFIFKFNGSII